MKQKLCVYRVYLSKVITQYIFKQQESLGTRYTEKKRMLSVPQKPFLNYLLPHYHPQAEDRLTPRWHVGQPCGKASWEGLVGKPRGEATDPLIHAKGSVILLLQLRRKAHVHAPTRNEV